MTEKRHLGFTILKLIPLVLCMAVLITTPAMASTKDELNNSLQETQVTQETKEGELSSLEQQLQKLETEKNNINKEIINTKKQIASINNVSVPLSARIFIIIILLSSITLPQLFINLIECIQDRIEEKEERMRNYEALQ